MAQKSFGAFQNATSTDKLRMTMQYAIVKDLAIWVTDSHILVKSDLDLWNCIDKNTIQFAEGKLLSSKVLQKMNGARVKNIEFSEDGVALYYSFSSAQPEEFHKYSGKVLDKDKNLFILLDIQGKEQYVMKEDSNEELLDSEGNKIPVTLTFPNVMSVIPTQFYNAKSELNDISNIGFSANLAVKIADCFCSQDGSGVSDTGGVKLLNFFDGNKGTRPFMVLPTGIAFGAEGYLKQFALLMPVIEKL